MELPNMSVEVVLVAQLCMTLWTLWTDCSPPASSVCGILQARILEWVVCIAGRFCTI